MSTPFLPDEMDLAILSALQDDFPLVSRPWKTIADRLGISESDMLVRMKKMAEAKIIRGISPVLESRHLGLHAATLIALRVPVERLEEVAAIVSSYPEVSHNFERDHVWSLWFTIAAQDRESLKGILNDILERTRIPARDALDLPTINRIKIDVRFSFISEKQQEITDGHH
jgi:DNA-binding Lrp family transcriptional regulator